MNAEVGAQMPQFQTDWFPLRLRIVALPPNRRLEGFDLSTFEIGQWYRVGERLAELLLLGDYGELESTELADFPVHETQPSPVLQTR
jgi:hypothetical protein